MIGLKKEGFNNCGFYCNQKNEINKFKDDMTQKNNEIEKLKSDINNYINEINKIKDDINEKNNIIQKLESDINNHINEINILKNENQKLNNELSNKLKLLQSDNIKNNLNNQVIPDNNNKIISLMEELKVKDNKINEFNELKDLIPVIFQTKDQKITYAIICRRTDKFNKIENILQEKFPELFEENEKYVNYFTIKGKKILEFKTMAQNNINYSDIIVVNKVEI